MPPAWQKFCCKVSWLAALDATGFPVQLVVMVSKHPNCAGAQLCLRSVLACFCRCCVVGVVQHTDWYICSSACFVVYIYLWMHRIIWAVLLCLSSHILRHLRPYTRAAAGELDFDKDMKAKLRNTPDKAGQRIRKGASCHCDVHSTSL